MYSSSSILYFKNNFKINYYNNLNTCLNNNNNYLVKWHFVTWPKTSLSLVWLGTLFIQLVVLCQPDDMCVENPPDVNRCHKYAIRGVVVNTKLRYFQMQFDCSCIRLQILNSLNCHLCNYTFSFRVRQSITTNLCLQLMPNIFVQWSREPGT